ncbi:MAG: phosphoribosylaminoimidazolesuccinocarboxamide synthase [Gammaproteobacteria bacterium]
MSMTDQIQPKAPPVLAESNLPQGQKTQGKVRDIYDCGDELLIVTTDRLSAFDRQIALIPYKGQVLNQLSAWWFEKTKSILPNHFIDMPDSNTMRVKKANVIPIEFVVRGYMTGSTNTSIWMRYNEGERKFDGTTFREGMRKNQQFASPLITPTTKEADHDRPITVEEIVSQNIMTAKEWLYVSHKIVELYDFGVEVASQKGLILVDTKYELARDENGEIILIDEIHTPDSSRYWLRDSYLERFYAQEEPESIDKEFLRLWFKAHCDPYHDETLPEAPEELVMELSRRYVQLYEMITGKTFKR